MLRGTVVNHGRRGRQCQQPCRSGMNSREGDERAEDEA